MTTLENAIIIAIGQHGFRRTSELHDLVTEQIGEMQSRRLIDEDEHGELSLSEEGRAAYEDARRECD